ncbi:hypothetical protein LJ207_09975 [Halanaerobium sp. Z-7514]|uniref:Uncharacterized protein n=1 Tax=Halanaerobium polyolivorans TaxID=2886943 RepID=A0AAW4X1F8_9FIRM|nr:hypothetical protein [Halanaerobium polyolivorans]MCC3145651.1 hypothetical protein [Halanaerobium polyolivorans]
MNDEETFQYYLSKELNVHVNNYGVGNYGLDQGILRMKRRFENDKSKYSIMAVTYASVARILSVWKHYHEFGNTFAVKPRFILDENNEIKLIESPVEKREDLLNLEEFKDFFHQYDYHYENWFLKHQINWGQYSYNLFKKPIILKSVIWILLNKLERKLDFEIPVINCKENYNKVGKKRRKIKYKELVEYHKSLFLKFEELFIKLIGEFVKFSKNNNAVPIFLPLKQRRYLEYEFENGSIFERIGNKLKEKYPDLIICNVSEKLHNKVENVNELYVGGHGHYSPKANQMIADSLSNIIKDLDCE